MNTQLKDDKEQRLLSSQGRKPLLSADGVTLRFGEELILENISFQVREGDFVSIIGPSGCGKSTLLNVLAGFCRPQTGTVEMEGRKVDQPGTERGVVFQDLALFPWLNVIENVAFGLKMNRVDKRARHERARAMLHLVGLHGREAERIQNLSGGMRQRVALARTLVMEPAILLMDEPFSALDAQTRDDLQVELLKIREQLNTTVVLVTHSIDEAIYLSDSVLLMKTKPGRIEEVIDVDLGDIRQPSIRTSARFNEYKQYFMDHLKSSHQ
ncbi:ABC transporter ATP-binding protein [Alicyclobacillus tolerans]|uniref:ABC transporter ATP-binding protein n=1 Tax=Alicyclobacillus tolerans TaxID=90970 RepID=UPI001F24F535|nr:ABC transporter ATP-binding protein [Alicyclobacillus tolerans]MCF8567292.1 ABC transporter ATP-binding protein [Alicyclobacillus tolerans]